MNLFVSDPCPVLSAHALDDKRVGKLLMEANQMLSLAVKFSDDSFDEFEHVGIGKVCAGLAHMNHPVSIWVRSSRECFEWTLQHAEALAQEWEYRFEREHASAVRTRYLRRFEDCLESSFLLPFQNSARNLGVGIDFSHLTVPDSYREYMKARWSTDIRSVIFTKRGPPSW